MTTDERAILDQKIEEYSKGIESIFENYKNFTFSGDAYGIQFELTEAGVEELRGYLRDLAGDLLEEKETA